MGPMGLMGLMGRSEEGMEDSNVGAAFGEARERLKPRASGCSGGCKKGSEKSSRNERGSLEGLTFMERASSREEEGEAVLGEGASNSEEDERVEAVGGSVGAVGENAGAVGGSAEVRGAEVRGDASGEGGRGSCASEDCASVMYSVSSEVKLGRWALGSVGRECSYVGSR